MGNPKHVFRLQLVHSICWEADPGLGEAKHLLSTPGKSGIEKIRFHLYHGTREEPTAGRLPCHHTSLWQLWAGADLIRKEQATLSRLLSQALGPDSEWRSLNPNSLKELGTRELPDLESSQIDAAVSELEWMFSELEAEKRRFFADVAWCLGARSSSRIVELGWPSIDSTSVPGYLEFQYRPSAQPWRREEIDPSRYIPDANAPFSAALLGEAWQALEHSDRSALVIMHIAAETATKECLASIVTGANHILEGVQSPPMPNILEMLCDNIDEDLVKHLQNESVWGQASGGFGAASSWVRKRASIRNKIVHGQDQSFTPVQVVEWLKLYECLISLLWLARERHEGVSGPSQRLFNESWGTDQV